MYSGNLACSFYYVISDEEQPNFAYMDGEADLSRGISTDRGITSGPFGEDYKIALADDSASKLFATPPYGRRKRREVWQVGPMEDGGGEEFFRCIRDLRGMTCPLPVSDRWYTAGHSCYHLLPLIPCGLLPRYMHHGEIISFCPGGEFHNIEMDRAGLSSRRITK